MKPRDHGNQIMSPRSPRTRATGMTNWVSLVFFMLEATACAEGPLHNLGRIPGTGGDGAPGGVTSDAAGWMGGGAGTLGGAGNGGYPPSGAGGTSSVGGASAVGGAPNGTGGVTAVGGGGSGGAGGVCGSGCTQESPTYPTCSAATISLVCWGPFIPDLATIMSANGCTDAATGAVRYCCPPDILTQCA